MCGIIACFGSTLSPVELRALVAKLQRRLTHRGPDWSGMYVHGNNIIAHERLAIVDVDNGAQPLTSGPDCSSTQTIGLGVNGEIYNYKELPATLKEKHTWSTKSDCEPILHMYEEVRPKESLPAGILPRGFSELLNSLDGIFAFVLYDPVIDDYFVARDAIGVNPLYYGYAADNSVWFASELKAIHDQCIFLFEFKPGTYMTRSNNHQWYHPRVPTPMVSDHWFFESAIRLVLPKIRHGLIAAVEKQMMADVPMGVLLSGGLDSSLISSITSRIMRQRGDKSELHSFSIGIANAPDLLAAREVAKFLGTKHHEYNFTVKEGIDALCSVIYHIETYDITTIRASTPMYLLARKIRTTGIKMVLSGEGADEEFGGYLYFRNAPSPKEFQTECRRRVNDLHLFDCLRANKSTQAWGLECRPPFLSPDFIDIVYDIDPRYMIHHSYSDGTPRIEKYILRKAFDIQPFSKSFADTQDTAYLPESILWRQKEQFSDGVGYSWIDSLIEYTTSMVSDDEFAKAAELYPINTPATKEAFYYRRIFAELFPGDACAKITQKWIPTWSADADPSGRVQQCHVNRIDASSLVGNPLNPARSRQTLPSSDNSELKK